MEEGHMAKPTVPEAVAGLDPHQIVRKSEGRKYFGFVKSTLNEKIKRGEIPPTFPLSDSGRAQGWTGEQIIAHHKARMSK
jgi:hypothetical protein